MTRFIVLALSFLTLVFAVTRRPLSDIPGGVPVVTVSSTVPADTTFPTITALVGPNSFDSSNDTFTLEISATVTAGGAAPVSQVLVVITSTNIPNYQFLLNLDHQGGDVWTVATSGVKCQPSGAWTASIKAITSVGLARTMSSADLQAAGYWSGFTITASCPSTAAFLNVFLGGFVNANCVGGSCVSTVRGNVTLSANPQAAFIYVSPSSGSDAYLQVSGNPSGLLAFDVEGDMVDAGIPSNSNGLFSIQSIGNEFVPPNGVWVARVAAAIGNTNADVGSTLYADEGAITAAGFSPSFTVTGGSDDITPPTCAAFSVSPNNVTTTPPDSGMVTYTATCSDAGVGLALVFAFLQGVSTPSGIQTETIRIDVTTPYNLDQIRPYFDGELLVRGVLAIDNSGNSVLYGDCGTATGYPICGGSSSGVATAATSSIAVALLVFTWMTL